MRLSMLKVFRCLHRSKLEMKLSHRWPDYASCASIDATLANFLMHAVSAYFQQYIDSLLVVPPVYEEKFLILAIDFMWGHEMRGLSCCFLGVEHRPVLDSAFRLYELDLMFRHKSW